MKLPKWIAGLGLLLAGLFASTKAASASSAEGTGEKAWTKAELMNLAYQKGLAWGVDPVLVQAIIGWESRGKWDPKAINPSDPSYGLGQVTPYIGVWAGVIATEADRLELLDPEKNTTAVAKFLKYLVERYPLNDAIQMYNLGETKFFKGLRVPAYLAGVEDYYELYKS